MPPAAFDVPDENGGAPPLGMTSSSLLERLTEINLDDLFEAAGLVRLRHSPVRRLLRPSARRFAQLAHEFDLRAGEQGLARGSAWLLHRMTAGVRVAGLGHVPATGPVVVLANHPGMTDTVALIASLESRPDLRVIALDRPFLRALPNVARRLIVVPDDAARRTGVLRAAAGHLRQGGALLTFPAGAIEPDPVTAGRAAAIASIRRWSGSFALFARLVPQTRFVPAIVGNVVSAASRRHPLARLRRTAQDRERLAAALQVALPRYQDGVARIAFGAASVVRGADADALRVDVVERLVDLIEATGDPSRGAG